jgi:mRNA-degrading endonuclease RelE of RelBE toxin-antitoxin system
VNYEIVPTSRFEKEAKKISHVYPGFRKDVEKLAASLAENPIQGKHLGHGVYKLRIPLTGKSSGKSYGARVIHTVFSVDKKVYLLSIYDKSVKRDLNNKELQEFIRFVKKIRHR